MVAEPGRIDLAHELLETAQIVTIRSLGPTNAQGYPVLDQPVMLHDPLEVVDGLAALDHEVLTDDLEEIHRRALVDDVTIVRHPQPHADPEVGNAQTCSSHVFTM